MIISISSAKAKMRRKKKQITELKFKPDYPKLKLASRVGFFSCENNFLCLINIITTFSDDIYELKYDTLYPINLLN